jgi:hypothetical protein
MALIGIIQRQFDSIRLLSDDSPFYFIVDDKYVLLSLHIVPSARGLLPYPQIRFFETNAEEEWDVKRPRYTHVPIGQSFIHISKYGTDHCFHYQGYDNTQYCGERAGK